MKNHLFSLIGYQLFFREVHPANHFERLSQNILNYKQRQSETMKFSRTEALLNSFAQTIVNRYRDKISEYASGKLYKTIDYSITSQNDSYLVTINLEEYWKFIEKGRRAGAKMPPVSAIENWIKVRKIIPRPVTLKSGRQRVPTVQQLAYVIARSISRKGIAPRPFMRESIEYTMKDFQSKLSAAVREDVLENLDSHQS